MKRPLPYFVRAVAWPDASNEKEPEPEVRIIAETLTLEAAQLEAGREIRRSGDYVCIVKRTHVIDVTPPEDPPGILWEWDQEVVEES